MEVKKLYQELHKKLSEIVNEPVDIRIYDSSSSVQWTLEEFFQNYNPEEIQKGQCNLALRFGAGELVVASCKLKDMFDCDGIIIMSDLFVYKDFRTKGIGSLITKFAMDFSKHYGYGLMQGSDKQENEATSKIFTKLNWKKVETFVNPKSKNPLFLWIINLNEYAG